MGKYILNCYTNWCGEDNDFGIITEDPNSPNCINTCQIHAYDNFSDFSGFQGVLEDMFPEVEDDEYTDSQISDAADAEGEYYGYTIEPYDEEVHGEWEWYDVIYNDTVDEVFE